MSLTKIERAYRNTTYLVDHPEGTFGILPGEPCLRLDALLAAHGVSCWAYVTAWNPRSEPCRLNSMRRVTQTCSRAFHNQDIRCCRDTVSRTAATGLPKKAC
ncbi:MAG: hypothetical protein Q8K18_00690 [Burkholderiales bacterium]|nr:hypothetical protein [Burkholderiales bacterium]